MLRIKLRLYAFHAHQELAAQPDELTWHQPIAKKDRVRAHEAKLLGAVVVTDVPPPSVAIWFRPLRPLPGGPWIIL